MARVIATAVLLAATSTAHLPQPFPQVPFPSGVQEYKSMRSPLTPLQARLFIRVRAVSKFCTEMASAISSCPLELCPRYAVPWKSRHASRELPG
ncbi:hypothetical protein DFJ77DRAFT_460045 [Powellomyces hirtus]|nr:hypothetical protein DFJ77DRAFT_460045 [Powellomyces hirtus]